MKKTIIGIIILLVLSIFVITRLSKTERSIQWKEYSSTLFVKGKDAHHLVLLFVKSDNCHWCQETEQTTFKKASIIQLINQHYYPVVLDSDKDVKTTEKYSVMDLPTIIILDANEKMIKVFSGYIPPEEIELQLNKISQDNPQ